MSDFQSRVTDALAESYTIEEELGAGGMAIVYLATDLKHGRKVAIKVMRPELAASIGGERFLQEIETVANLSHPHILAVHDSGHINGLLYFVMPFVDGESLGDRMKREGPLPIDDAVTIASEVADALAHAHSHGVIHRDIKPDNIMLYGGHAVIADFGIAKAARQGGADQLTGTGMSLGTPSYMSPEQATADEVDSRTDIYALSCMLYEMLVGQAPFTGHTAQAVIQQHVVAPPPSASDSRPTVPVGLSRAIQRGMAKTPADRFSTASEFSRTLTSYAGDGVEGVVRTRVLQGMAVYAGVTVAVYWLLKMVVDRLVWSPHLPNFGAIAMITLTPMVFVLASMWARGGHLSRAGKFGVPVNAAGAVVVLWLVFGSTDLGAATTTVLVEDEDGNTVERVIPKSEFRKNLLLFPFDQGSGDEDARWMQHGIPIALDVDLEQDMFITVSSSEALVAKYRERGYPNGLGLPLTLKRELAEEAHAPMFVAGSYTVAGGELRVDVKLYETERGKLMTERSYAGSLGIIGLADEISVGLKRDLGVATQHIEDTEDLPLADQLTSSDQAFRHLTDAYRAVTFEQDWAGAGSSIQASVALDSTNAYAQLLAYSLALYGNDRATAARAIESAMRHSYKLPERTQFQVKMQYYDFRQEAEKSLRVAEMRVELFGDDIEGRAMLAQLYQLRDRAPDAMAQLEAILEIDPAQSAVLRQLGTLAMGEGEYDRAAEYFQRYADEHPDEPASHSSLASLQRLRGNFEGARNTYERALLLEPGNIQIRVNLATLERHLGRFDAGVAALEATLEEATSAQDSLQVIGALGQVAEESGRMNDAVAYLEQAVAVMQGFLPVVPVLSQRLQRLGTYVAAGQTDQARMILSSVEQQLQSPYDQLAWMGHLAIAMELEDAGAIEAAIPGVEMLITALGVGMLRPNVLMGTGRALELRGDCAEALPRYQEALEIAPNATSVHRYIGRCHRVLGDLDAAEASLARGLGSAPFDPKIHYELALVSAGRGDSAQAIQHLETALSVWREADDGFGPAARAREHLAEWR